MKRLIAFLLCIALLTGGASLFASAADVEGTDIPTIYVVGVNADLYAPQPDGSVRKIFGIELPEGFIQTTVKENLDVFKRAFFTQQWDEFCGVLRDVFVPLYDELRLDENGEPTDGSYVNWSWNRWTLDGRKVGGKYPTERYCFEYDWRLDPYKTAEVLHRYIEDVLAVTGETKVNLVGRCLGACITAAYMEKYDGQYVSDYLLYCGALYGATQCSKAFCGELYLESGGVERFVYDLDLTSMFADDVLVELVQSAVSLLRMTYGLDIACWAVNNVYRQIYLNIVPQILIDTYASFPGYWSMVSDRDYEKAKQTVFYGADMEKYKNFIRIIDNYHYNVQVRTPELFRHYREMGINVSDIVKYGYQSVPVTRHSDMLSDILCSAEDASFGAVTSPIDGTLKKSYLKTADMRYVSPDRQIDASACLLPDRTWFIKNLAHKNFPESADRLIDFILNEDATVFDSEEYPQYMVYDDETESIEPQTAENCDTTKRYRHRFFDELKRFIRALRIILRRQKENKRSAS